MTVLRSNLIFGGRTTTRASSAARGNHGVSGELGLAASGQLAGKISCSAFIMLIDGGALAQETHRRAFTLYPLGHTYPEH